MYSEPTIFKPFLHRNYRALFFRCQKVVRVNPVKVSSYFLEIERFQRPTIKTQDLPRDAFYARADLERIRGEQTERFSTSCRSKED
jgi:hypothetical protein